MSGMEWLHDSTDEMSTSHPWHGLSLSFRAPGPVLLIWDRLPGHRAAARFLQCTKIAVEYLPAYAPELNPVEWVWSQTKHAELANWVPDDTEELEEKLHDTLAEFNQEQKLLRSFFAGAEFSLE